MDAEALEREIRAFLRDDLAIEEAQLGRDDELLSTGLIASMDLARLATFLEQRLEMAIPDRDIGAVHFDSIAKILAYVEARQSE